MTSQAAIIAGARQGRPSSIQKLAARAMARDLRCLIVPGPEVALAYGLDVEAAGLQIADSPRDAGVLLVMGELPPGLGETAAVLYAQMPRPRAILMLGRQAPPSLPHADVSAGLSQAELLDAAGRLQQALAEGAFAASPGVFDASVLHANAEQHGDSSQGHHQGDHEHEHAGHDHDAMGFMSMVEITKDLPRSADGLPMDWIEVPFGPCFPGLPGGLRLTLTLDGDGVAKGHAASVTRLSVPDAGVEPGAFVERLAAATPLAPVSYRLLACRAIERAAGLEEEPVAARARASALERERIASHLGWLVQLGRQLGFTWLTRRATALQLLARHATRDSLVALQPAVQALTQRLRRTPLLNTRLKGIGTLLEGFPDLRGPVARASGRAEDVRQAEATYRELGFEVLTGEGGDARARLRQRLVEIMASLDLIEAAGVPDIPVPHGIGSASGVGKGIVETPRGRAELSLTLERGHVVSVELDTACGHHIGLVPGLVEGRELGDALVAVGSLDLSPWEVIA